MMVCLSICDEKFVCNILAGTGLTDGFPPGGIDAHDVRPHTY